MRYYVTADPHGFCSILKQELEDAGFFSDPGPRKLVILGDLMDRGDEPLEMQAFLLDLMAADAVILVRGNHEDLFCQLATTDGGRARSQHRFNGTYDTALRLTGFPEKRAQQYRAQFAAAARRTDYYRTIIPSTVDYFETAHYIFVHGWIPARRERDAYVFRPDWREADEYDWERARWHCGMDLARTCPGEKTILCGHRSASYGHAVYERRGSEDGPDADYTTFRAPGIIALDACTVLSHRINIEILEDDPLT